MNIFGSLGSLKRLLDYHLTRHNVLSSNLANAETPGYRARELRFSQALQQAGTLSRSDPAHLEPPGQEHAGTLEVGQEATGLDRNGVSLERQMAKLAANRMRFEAGVEIARRRIGLLRYAATDGRQ